MSVFSIIKKDLTVEWRQKAAFFSVILFCAATVFVVYKSHREFTPQSWITFFWILFLFVVINVILKSFTQEGGKSTLFYYSLLSPLKVLIAKLLYNFCWSFLLGLFLWFLLGLFTFNPIADSAVFLGLLAAVSLGFSAIFSFTVALSKSENTNATLVAVLGIPLTLPILLLAIKISATLVGLLGEASLRADFTLLLGIDLLLAGVTILLFPLLWKS